MTKLVDPGYHLILDLFNLGIFPILINKSHCPRTITAIEKILPIKSRGIKRQGVFVINSELKTRAENEKDKFKAGDISVDPSSGNLTIYLEDKISNKLENYLGRLIDYTKLVEIRLTQGLEIRSD